MVVFEDLLDYSNGIYHYNHGEIIGAHAILLVGWGSDENGQEYWEVQNSWGEDWGYDGGFFMIKMDESQVASDLFGGGFTCEPELVQKSKGFLGFFFS